jgi:hypothetical protein
MTARFIPALFALLLASVATTALAAGNHPEAGTCPPNKPYYAICTHSFHSLEGWAGNKCYATPEEAQKDAEAHANKEHGGNMRWTGVAKTR